jgi:hypothetical protein
MGFKAGIRREGGGKRGEGRGEGIVVVLGGLGANYLFSLVMADRDVQSLIKGGERRGGRREEGEKANPCRSPLLRWRFSAYDRLVHVALLVPKFW